MGLSEAPTFGLRLQFLTFDTFSRVFQPMWVACRLVLFCPPPRRGLTSCHYLIRVQASAANTCGGTLSHNYSQTVPLVLFVFVCFCSCLLCRKICELVWMSYSALSPCETEMFKVPGRAAGRMKVGLPRNQDKEAWVLLPLPTQDLGHAVPHLWAPT